MSIERIKGRKIGGSIAGLYRAGMDDFVTTAVDVLDLGFAGIEGDGHGGLTRRTGGREPWYNRGTEIRNERQLSLLAVDEMQAVAEALDISELKPEWIGGNVLVEGIPNFTHLPPRTLLFFASGLTLKIDGDNHPCKLAGRGIARHVEGHPGIEASFVKAAKNRRGLVAWVEKPGRMAVGDKFETQIPEQWIYP